MMHKTWCSIEEVPRFLLRSSIKFEGHTGWKIDLNPIWVRLLGQSQLSNPSDLPCWIWFGYAQSDLQDIQLKELTPWKLGANILFCYFCNELEVADMYFENGRQEFYCVP